MADGSFTLGAEAPADDLLSLIDVAQRKYRKVGNPPLLAARLLLTTAVHLFARHAGAAEAAAVCAETVAEVRTQERRLRPGG